MRGYVIKRLLMVIPILWGVSVVTFVMMRVLPGDAAVALVADSPADLERLRASLGLDKPLYVQYSIWVWHVVQGDLGNSIQLRRPVVAVLLPQFVNTLILTVGSMSLAILVGWSVGILSARRQYSLPDRLTMLITLFGISMPSFWLGLVLIWVFAYYLQLLPGAGMYAIRGDKTVGELLIHLILPALTTAAVPAAIMARMTRSSMLEVIRQDYIRTIRAKGVPERVVILKHALKNALPPILNITGLQLGFLLGGAIFTEVIFSWPGIGLQLYSSISGRDYPMVQGFVLLTSLCFVLVNLVIDILTSYVDPRITVS
jgi:peptide/nickel transport system permease protein